MLIFTPNSDKAGIEIHDLEQTNTYFSLREKTCIPNRYYTANLKDYSREITETVLIGKSYWVCGKAGTGKTHLLCATMNYYNALQAFGHFKLKTVPVPHVKYNGYMKSRLFVHHTQIDAFEFNVETLYDIPQLFIDDLGTGRATEFTRSRLEGLFNNRYNKNLPVWFSTNLDQENLNNCLGTRIMRRIKELSNEFTLY